VNVYVAPKVNPETAIGVTDEPVAVTVAPPLLEVPVTVYRFIAAPPSLVGAVKETDAVESPRV
jgi:hypothetical protein